MENRNLFNANDIIKINISESNPSWKTVLISKERSFDSFASVIIGSLVYLFGGYKISTKTLSNSLQTFDLKNLEFKIINENILMPSARLSSSMVVINYKLYLFGGINSDSVFSDLWIFNLANLTWIEAPAKGSIPSARYSHAFAASGNAFAIWGGRDLAGLRDDFFLFNTITEIWTEFLPSSSSKPRPAFGACMVFMSPSIYLYGGKTESDISNELWKYEIGTNNFSLVSNKGLRHAKHSFCFYNMSRIYIAFGSMDEEEPSSYIDFYDLNEDKWNIYHSHVKLQTESAQANHVFIDPEIIRIGGENWMFSPVYNIDVLYPGNIVKTINWKLNKCIYAGASAYFNKSIYMFGGGTVIGRSLRAEVAHNIFAVIKVDEICEEAGCNAKCSPGTYVSGKVCAVCAKGTYSSGLDNQQCSICPSGTYNDNFGSSSSEQCLPCPQGTYTDSNGSQTCLTCPIGKYCPVGSSHPVDNFNYISSSSLQPRLFHKKNLYLSLFIYQILVSVPIIIVLVICIIIPKCRVKILKFDMFDTSHENTENNYVITKKTLMGGFFSIIYIIGTFLLIGSTFISYIEDNIQESKALIPLVVLESEVNSIKSQGLSVQLWLDLYGGQSEENSRCLRSSLISFTGLSY